MPYYKNIPLRRPLYGALLLALAGAAMAQEAAPNTTADKAKVLDTVKVTAQSREQSLQEVPIAIQVIDNTVIDQLAANTIGDIDSFIPGLTVDDISPTQPRYTIRGVGTSDFGMGTDPAVGVYIDGVYAARTGGALLAFNDIERIEVLKGPQGTLFGRNTSAGAISIITKKPSQQQEGNATLRVGNDGQEYLSGLLNMPVTDNSALRIGYVSNKVGNWLTNAATGEGLGKQNNWASKIAWRTHFSSGATLDFSWDHEEINQPARPTVGLVPLAPYPATAPFPADPSTYVNPLTASIYNDVPSAEKRVFNGATLQINKPLAWANMSYTAAYRSFNTLNRDDRDGTDRINLYFDTANIEDNSSQYQELKFSGVHGPVDWVAGISWYNEDAKQVSQTNTYTDTIDTVYLNFIGAPIFSIMQGAINANSIPANVLGQTWRESMYNTGQFKSSAAFGDAIWHVNDKLNLTFGVRYTNDKKAFSWENGAREAAGLDQTLALLNSAGFLQPFYAYLASINPMLPLLYSKDVVFDFSSLGVEGRRIKSNNSWSNVSPRFVADYKIAEHTMLWGSYTQGYKAGGYNSVQINSKFNNEDVVSYELGLKSEFPEAGLSLSTSLFNYVYKDRQTVRLDPNTSSGIPQYLVDTSDEQGKGWEAQIFWHATEGLSLNFSSQYLNQTYKRYVNTSGTDLSGQATGVPYWSIAGGGNYAWLFGDGSKLEFSIMHSYIGANRCNADSQAQGTCQLSPVFTIGAEQQRTDARLQWNTASDRWAVSAFVRNLANNRYVLSTDNITLDVLGTSNANISEPRRYGLELKYQF